MWGTQRAPLDSSAREQHTSSPSARAPSCYLGKQTTHIASRPSARTPSHSHMEVPVRFRAIPISSQTPQVRFAGAPVFVLVALCCTLLLTPAAFGQRISRDMLRCDDLNSGLCTERQNNQNYEG